VDIGFVIAPLAEILKTKPAIQFKLAQILLTLVETINIDKNIIRYKISLTL